MKESHNEGIASHIGPESWRFGRKAVSQALTGEGMDWVMSLESKREMPNQSPNDNSWEYESRPVFFSCREQVVCGRVLSRRAGGR